MAVAFEVPTHQIAAWVNEPGPESKVEIRSDVEVPSPGEGEVLVKIECTGVCHSDVSNINGHTPSSVHIAGHEGVGRVVKVGPGVDESNLQQRVGVKWIYSWCGNCEICEEDYTTCPNQHNCGRDVPGTFQQYVVSPLRCLTPIPKSLSSEVAAPLLCAGISAYSSVAKTNLKPGQWIAISGAGGGLGHLAVQIAREKGLKVIAIDGGNEKKELSLKLGATAFIDYRDENVIERVKELTSGYGVHAAVCMIPTKGCYRQSLDILRRTGTLVCIGLDREVLPISPLEMIVRGTKIVGSSVGTEDQIQDLFKLAIAGKVTPQLEVFEFNALNSVLEKLVRAEVHGRAVVTLPE